jgi:cation transport ATPase
MRKHFLRVGLSPTTPPRRPALSLGYNAVGVALAMTGHLTPLVAAILMPVSSVTVVLGSWRSRTFDRAAA